MPRAGVLATAIAAAAMMAGTALASDWRGEAVDWTDVDGVDRTALYPAVGGDPQANVRLDNLGSKLLGANGNFVQSPQTSPQNSWGPIVMDKLKAAGMNTVRRIVSWTEHEHFRDDWDRNGGPWQHSRAFYAAARTRGLTPIMVLTSSPYWANPGCPNPPLLNRDKVSECNKPPADTTEMNLEWAEFVQKAAQEFPDAVFEIWNEPNSKAFWDGPLNPTRWAALTSIAANVINFVSPRARVIGCACVGHYGPSSTTLMNIGEFLSRALAVQGANSIRGKLDGVSFHFRPQDYNPFAPLDFGAGSHFAAIVKQVREALALAGEAGKDLWIDEVGYWTADAGNQWHVVNDGEAAVGDAELARLALTTPDIKAVVIHRDVDEPDPGANQNSGAIRQSTMGLLRRDLSPKPALCRFGAMFGHYTTPSPEGLSYTHPGCSRVAAPNTALSSAPPVLNAPRDVEFFFSGSGAGPNLFECRLDGGGFRRCASPISYGGLSLGVHAFHVRAYRLDGAQDETPAQWVFSVSGSDGTTTTTTTSPTSTAPTTTTTTAPATSTTGGGTTTTTTGKTSTTTTGKTTTTTTGRTSTTTRPGGEPPPPPGCDIAGTRGNDVLRGTRRSDRICGLGGDDKIYALGGKDAIVGGRGRDRIMGGTGADAILGDNSADRLMGGSGNDWISGGRGNDRLRGGPGKDVLKGGPGRNRKRD